jgi:hypothetical protein
MIASPGFAGARSNAKRCGGSIAGAAGGKAQERDEQEMLHGAFIQ